MIIVRLTGGIGNQLFQYAFCRSLAISRQTELKLDVADFKLSANREYSLKHFNIIEEFATPEELSMIYDHGKKGWRMLSQKINFLTKHIDERITLAKERHFHFDPDALKIRDNSFVQGYWQSEKYFKKIEKTIRKEFTVKYPLEGNNLSMAELIEKVNSVSLHIRRGDYISNPLINRTHGVCNLDYYLKSVEELAKVVDNPHFFIFSDDPAWTKKYLKLEYPLTFADHNGSEEAHEDLRLMSLCKHHIMANSSFSWWGAWLNSKAEKIVIAPKKWFQSSSLNVSDLLPECWIKI